MRHGDVVSTFEKMFAERVGAKHAIGMTNGTVTLEVALRAMDVGKGDTVQTTPLTMAATTIAILNAGATPRYHDVDSDTWLMRMEEGWATYMPVSLYGLHMPGLGTCSIDDAAQTLRPHSGAAFTSYSLQRSKILNTGEGGVLVTNSDHFAEKARSIASLGYKLSASQSRIDSSAIKSPDTERHHIYPSLNARMNDATAALGIQELYAADYLLNRRREAAAHYLRAIEECSWIRPQRDVTHSGHDYWTFAIALESKELWRPFTDAIVRHGGEMPYGAWALTFDEPMFRLPGGVLLPTDGLTWKERCPNAISLQPCLVQFQTNDLASAERNAKAVKEAIKWLDVTRRQRKAFEGWHPIPQLAPLDRIPSADATGTPCS